MGTLIHALFYLRDYPGLLHQGLQQKSLLAKVAINSVDIWNSFHPTTHNIC